MYIIGISAFYHDSALCLINSVDGKILFGIQEERLSRKKNDSSFPNLSLKKIKTDFNIKFQEIEAIVFYEKPFLKLSRVLDSLFSNSYKSFELYKNFMYSFKNKGHGFKSEIDQELKKIWKNQNFKEKIFFNFHHLSHAASTYYNSPFTDSAILTIDGVGEWDTYTLSVGEDSKITKIESTEYPNSLGFFYSTFTAYCGFKANSGEYKFMGLSPFGKPIYADFIEKKFIVLKDDGVFKLNKDLINPNLKQSELLKNIENIFKVKRNKLDGEITEFYANIACSVQLVTEKCILSLVKRASKLTKKKSLCLAGGVALNCVANQKIVDSGLFKNVFVFPGSGDAGAAVGAAQSYYFDKKNTIKYTPQKIFNPYIGSSYDVNQIESDLLSAGAIYKKFKSSQNDDLVTKVATLLQKNKIGAVFLGKCEFGPRALGARSIIGNPTDPKAQIRINAKTKFRESFRPFAPVVLKNDANKIFDIPSINKANYGHMLYTVMVREELRRKIKPIKNGIFDVFKIVSRIRSKFPSITHIDYTARVQTVDENSPKMFSKILKRFKRFSGHSVLINTSFNIRGEPIVESPFDAFRTFMATDLDFLVFENFLLLKKDQISSRDMFIVEFEND